MSRCKTCRMIQSDTSIDWGLCRDCFDSLLEIARAAEEIKVQNDKQRAHTIRLQELADEARRTGKSLTHKIPPVAFDYGDSIGHLLAALADAKKRGVVV